MSEATKLPVDEMEGRALDAAVHIEVFGWDEDDVDVNGLYGTTFDWDVESRSFAVVPPYSTDIAAAWSVVGRMADIYEVGLNHYERDWQFHVLGLGQATAETAPEAICRAALKAVRSEP